MIVKLLDEDRRRIEQLADALIPGGEGMPSASAAGVAGSALDRVLAIRDDLDATLRGVLAVAGDPKEVMRALHAEQNYAFESFVLLITCSYTLTGVVRDSLGYPGQIPRPIPAARDVVIEDLLAVVAARGPRYVPTPAKGSP